MCLLTLLAVLVVAEVAAAGPAARALAERDADRELPSAQGERALADAADLAVWAFVDEPVGTGDPFHAYVEVANFGPSPATGVELAVTLPAGSAFGSVDAPAGTTCLHDAGTVTCTIASVAVEDWVALEITATAPATPGDAELAAEITAQTPSDPYPRDNATTSSFRVSEDADLVLFQRAEPVPPGQDIRFDLDVWNRGPKAALGVTLTDDLPAGHELRSVTAPDGTTCTSTATTVTCETATLPAGATLEIGVVVSGSPQAALVRNVARVAAASPADPDADSNESEGVAVVGNPPHADLRLYAMGEQDWTDENSPGAVGAPYRYTLFVSNEGPSVAQGVDVTARLPNGVSYTSATSTRGACIPAGQTVTCSLGSLSAFSEVELTITVTPSQPGTVATEFEVVATGGPEDPYPRSNRGVVETEILPAGWTDLVLHHFGPTDAAVGTAYRYTLGVWNRGPSASDVTVQDTLPPGLDFVSATPESGTCSFAQATRTVTCALGTLARDAFRVLDVVVVPTSTGEQSHTASVPAGQDPQPGDNDVVIRTQVWPAGAANLETATTVLASPAAVGEPLRLHVQVFNNGPTAAQGVVLSDTLPAGATFVSATATGGGSCTAPSAGVLQCTLGAIKPGATGGVSLVVTPTVAGSLTNQATASFGSGVDPRPQNDSSTARLDVVADVADGTTAQMAGASVHVDPETSYVTVSPPWTTSSSLVVETTAQCPGGGAVGPVSLRIDGEPYSMPGVGGGRYRAVVPVQDLWEGDITVAVVCPGGTIVNAVGALWVYPPFGQALDAGTGAPLDGVTVTLHHVPGWMARQGSYQNDVPESCETTWSKPWGSSFSQPAPVSQGVVAAPAGGLHWPLPNPLVTTSTGQFGWFLAPGCWFVVASKPGYESVTSPVFGGDAESISLDLRLRRIAPPPAPPPPPPPPPPAVDRAAPALTLKAAAQKLRAALRSGVRATVGCNEACSLRAELRLAASTARKLKLGAVVGTASRALPGAGSAKLAIRLKPAARRKLAKVRSVRLTIAVVGRDPSGNAKTVRRAVTLRR